MRVMECGVSTVLFFDVSSMLGTQRRGPENGSLGLTILMQEGELSYWPKVMTPKVQLP